jgi:uncharacterized protein YlzI (FlbEa/FlbD family)
MEDMNKTNWTDGGPFYHNVTSIENMEDMNKTTWTDGGPLYHNVKNIETMEYMNKTNLDRWWAIFITM